MLKKLILPILLATALGPIISCNSSTDDEEYTYTQSSSVTVTAFSLNDNSNILDSLSNVFFSIDLVNAKIFNADSLPYGTDVSRLIPNITTPSTASEVNLTYYCTKTSRDSVVNYLTNSTDSIDFSNGPVKLTVKSQSGAVVRDYEIRVNVHQVKADSLAWYSIASAPLPSGIAHLKSQYTVRMGSTYYCLATDGASYSVAVTDDPANGQWQQHDVQFGFVPKVESLRASDNALYILTTDGELYSSTDFAAWTPTGQSWHYIYGGYRDQVLGCVISATGNTINSYPSGRSWSMPAVFPVDGTSQTATYTMNMGYSPQLVMTGGRTSNGLLTAYSWSFDGDEWCEVSTLPLPTALEDMTMVPYQLVDVPSSTWAPQAYPALLAFGGRTAQGSINRTVYYSRDWGMTWRTAPELVQWPDEMPTIYGMTAYEYTTTMHVSRGHGQWTELPLAQLPPQCQYMLPCTTSRAIAPLTQWECPAIYLYGGRYYDGTSSDKIWRGVIYHFTFKPVQ